MKPAKLCALFLISIVNIAYELYVMRAFSIGGRESFGSIVISVTLLGTGISGIILIGMLIFSGLVPLCGGSLSQGFPALLRATMASTSWQGCCSELTSRRQPAGLQAGMYKK
ncbi:MAG: hypothetical protein LBJ86_03810 [Spirochaetaceae bacterium]|jgi:hypothetical protein|nr:hypothetical protein [Spirochaetaceae bacterium]